MIRGAKELVGQMCGQFKPTPAHYCQRLRDTLCSKHGMVQSKQSFLSFLQSAGFRYWSTSYTTSRITGSQLCNQRCDIMHNVSTLHTTGISLLFFKMFDTASLKLSTGG